MTKMPAWLESLVDAVAKCMQPHNVLGPLGCRWGEQKNFWEVMVYPSAAELVGGAEDGVIVVPGFSLDLWELGKAFEEVTAVHWQSHAFGPHDQAGPHVSIEGCYKGHQVFLQVWSEANPDEGPGFKVAALGPVESGPDSGVE